MRGLSRADHTQVRLGLGSRAAVLRRKEGKRFSSPSDDEVGGCQARSARSEQSERSNQIRHNMMTKPLRRGSAPPPSGLSADTPPK